MLSVKGCGGVTEFWSVGMKSTILAVGKCAKCGGEGGLSMAMDENRESRLGWRAWSSIGSCRQKRDVTRLRHGLGKPGVGPTVTPC